MLLYINTINHQWVLDDYSVIKENRVTQQGFAGVKTHFQNTYRHGYGAGFNTLYRPLTPAMFAIEWGISPDNPKLMHGVNILFYGATGFLLFFMLARVFKDNNILLPLAAALIFIAHPLHTESVANIKGRDDIMGFFFFILAVYWLWDYLQKGHWKWIALSMLSFVGCVFSKESSITFIAVFPLLIYFFSKVSLSKNATISLGYVVIAGIFMLIRSQILPDDVGVSLDKTSPLDSVLVTANGMTEQKATAFMILGRYLKLLFVPHPLVSDAGLSQIPLTSWSDWKVLLSFGIHAGLGIFALLNIKKKSILSFAILFYIITFSATSNILVNIGTSYAERLLYVPVLGFAIALAYGLLKLFNLDMNRSKEFAMADFFQKNIIAIVLLGIVVVGFSIKTVVRNKVWKDSFSLYEADIKTSPNCAKLNYHYALELKKAGQALPLGQEKNDMMLKAKAQFERAIEIYPNYADAYMQIGVWHYNAKLYDASIPYYEKSIEIKAGNPKAYSNLGTSQFEKANLETDPNLRQQLFAQAKANFRTAIEQDPSFADAYQNLGAIIGLEGNDAEALRLFKIGLKYATSNEQKAMLNNFINIATSKINSPQ